MKINSIKKALKISILMTVILALPIMYTMATENAITYTLSEDKKSAVIHLDINKVIGSNELVEVKDQDNNLLTEYDITVTENGTYTYTVSYKKAVIKESEVVIDDSKSEQSETQAHVEEGTENIDIAQEQEKTTESAKLETETQVTDENDTNAVTEKDTIADENKIKSSHQSEPEKNQNSISEEENIIYEVKSEVLEITIDRIIKEDKSLLSLEEDTSNEFEFNKETGTITGYTLSETSGNEVIIPDQISGKDVLYIGENAFKNKNISKVTFMTTKLKGIGENAFYKSGIQEITIPESVETIGKSAFSYCKSLTKIILPKGLTKIENSILSSCQKLKAVEIPESVTSIGDNAFYGVGIQEILIPESVEIIGKSVFVDCENLTKIEFSDNSKVRSIGAESFLNTAITTIALPKSITRIEDWLLASCKSLTTVEIPEGVTSIGENAFYGSSRLSTINLPNSLTDIENRAFFYCTNLKSIQIPDNVTVLSNGIFHECENLTEIILPDGLISIEDEAFAGCVGLKSIKFPNSLKRIGSSAFSGPELSSINLPKSVEYIGGDAFGSVNTVTIESEENDNISIDKNAFNSTVVDIYIPNKTRGSIENVAWGATHAKVHWKDMTEMAELMRIGDYDFNVHLQSIIKYYGTESEVNIPETFKHPYDDQHQDKLVETEVKSIGKGSFEECNMKSVNIPDSVNKMYIGAFSGCTKLERISLPNHLTYMEGYMFYGCTELKEVSIPYGISAIYAYTFYGCTNLEEVTIPNSVISIYEAAIADCSQLKEIFIPNSVTYISAFVFEGCSQLKKISISKNVTSLGMGAFEGCSQLTEIVLPNKIKTIYNRTFNGCTNLSHIVLPKDLEKLEGNIFNHTNMKTIRIPKNVIEMNYKTFNETQLEKIYIDSNRYSIINSGITEPWSAPDNAIIFYAGDNLEFKHSVKKSDNDGYDIYINANVPKSGVFIHTIELPNGEMKRIDAKSWSTKGDYVYHVDHDGIYTFKGYDSRNIEYIYDVKVKSVNVTYHSNISSSNDTIIKKETLIGENYIIDDYAALNMSRDDAVFIGWNTSPNGTANMYYQGDEITVDGNIDLYAQWKSYPEGTVLFQIRNIDQELGELDKTEYAGTKGERLGNNIAKVNVSDIEGSTFIGWYKDNHKIENISNEMIGNNTVFEARFIIDIDKDGQDDRLNKYKVCFVIRDSDKEKAVLTKDSIEVRYNQQLGDQVAGYNIDYDSHPIAEFVGWYKNDIKVEKLKNEVITESVTYEARFKEDYTKFNKYRMNYIIDIEAGILDNSYAYISQIIETDGTVSVPSVTVNEGKKFMGWYKEGDIKQTIINETDIKLSTATYIAKVKNIYEITYKIRDSDTQKGSIDNLKTTVVSGTKLDTALPKVTTQKWAKFIGWYVGDNKIDNVKQYIVTESLELEARFELAEDVIIIPGTDGVIDTADDIIIQPGKKDDKGNIVISNGGTITHPDGSIEEFPNGGVITPGADGIIGTEDDVIIKSGTVDDKGNITIPDGGTIIYPDGSKEELPNGGVITPGADGIIGTDDDVIIKSGTVDDKGNIIIPNGGTIIYPDGSKEELPNGGVITPGADGIIGTEDDVIIKSGTVDDKGNIIIPDGGTIIYPDGSHKDFPNGGIILPGEDGELGTKDDIIVKPGTIDDKGNIIIPNGGVIIYPNGRSEEFPNGGTLYAGMDGIFGTNDDLLIRNIKEDSPNTINISTDNQDNNNNKQTIIDNALTSDDTQVLLWSFIGVVSIFGAIASVKKKLKL